MLVQIVTENGQKKIIPLTADAGAGNPVGTIIVVCSNILPSGYLGLGVQYDITNYPALYQVLGTDTTPTASALGLPTLTSGQYAIKATSGLTENQQENVLNTINENNSYSTEEHPTGKKWIDGKPTYEIVITGLTFGDTINTWTNCGYTFSNCDTFIKGTARRTTDNATLSEIGFCVTNNVLRYHTGIGFSNCNQVIAEYTKTTD